MFICGESVPRIADLEWHYSWHWQDYWRGRGRRSLSPFCDDTDQKGYIWAWLSACQETSRIENKRNNSEKSIIYYSQGRNKNGNWATYTAIWITRKLAREKLIAELQAEIEQIRKERIDQLNQQTLAMILAAVMADEWANWPTPLMHWPATRCISSDMPPVRSIRCCRLSTRCWGMSDLGWPG